MNKPYNEGYSDSIRCSSYQEPVIEHPPTKRCSVEGEHPVAGCLEQQALRRKPRNPYNW